MRTLILPIVFALAACAAQPSNNEPAPRDKPSATTSQASAASKDNGQEIICRRESEVGSHFSRRVCRTRAEIEAARQESVEIMDDTRAQDSNAVLSE